MNNQEKLNTFMSITGNTSFEEAFSKLESTEQDLQKALELDNNSSIPQNIYDENVDDLNNTTHTDETNNENDSNIFRTADNTITDQLIDNSFDYDENYQQVNQSNNNDLHEFLCPNVKLPDYIHKNMSLEEAKYNAKNDNKIFLLAIALSSDTLQSIHMTRDYWVHDIVKEMLNYDFYCWQIYDDEQFGKSFCRQYKITSFPFICILESSTGLKLTDIKINGDYNDFCCSIDQYIESVKPTYAAESNIKSTEVDESNTQSPQENESVQTDNISDNAPDYTVDNTSDNKVTDQVVTEIKEFIEPTENYNTLQFKFTDNTKSFIRKFSKSDPIQLLYDYIQQEYSKNNFNLFQSWPKKRLNESDILGNLNLEGSTITIQCN